MRQSLMALSLRRVGTLGMVCLYLTFHTSGVFARTQSREPFVTLQSRAGEPYQLIKDGKIVDAGLTDKNGVITTSAHHVGQQEDWLIRTVSQDFGLHFSGKSSTPEIVKIKYYTDLGDGINQESSSGDSPDNKFVYFILFGKDGTFPHEPYQILYKGKVVDSGKTNERGRGFTRKLSTSDLIHSFSVRLCSGATFSVRKVDESQKKYSMSNYFDVSAASKTDLDSSMKAQCQNSELRRYSLVTAQFNHGNPFLDTGVGYGQTPDEQAAVEAAKEKADAALAEAEKQAYAQGKTQFSAKEDIAPQGRCPDDLVGTFGIPASQPTDDVMNVAHGYFFSDKTLAGDAAFKIYKSGSDYYKQGMKSGTVSKITISEGKAAQSGIIDFVMWENPYCYIDTGDGRIIYRVDFSHVSDKVLNTFLQYLSAQWGVQPSVSDLKNIHYFFGYNISEPGVGGGSLLIPLQRMAR
ncbi:hypothetical protein [Atlantibacter hermannii]|uniref:hypothetical protein n=1 Tax=Atlantibacter hermannii TaxID=565 RepID=UPI0019333B12|nr:hypothetical protein [Atlantibacter hermannii]MBL7636490.1 hypothetical protein [Atlantibacter hermannii]MBL7675768.1 hypothetical protein [Atlantibacter hermannii]MCZ7833804.1 hypothetical protein [Atlantibacter hermannii]